MSLPEIPVSPLEDAAFNALLARQHRFRVKLVTSPGPDAHYWYSSTFEDALATRDVLLAEIPAVVEPKCWIYVDTSLGHVRVA